MRAPSGCVFEACGIYRSDVSSHLFTPGPVPLSGRAGAGYRTRRKERALPIVRDEFRPAIPRRVARQRCPSPLHRHHQLKIIARENGTIYHRMVTFFKSLLNGCLTPGDKRTDKPKALKSAAGTHQIQLMDIESVHGSAAKNQLAEAKGFLIRNPMATRSVSRRVGLSGRVANRNFVNPPRSHSSMYNRCRRRWTGKLGTS
jgi:hypothetical protein